MSTLPADCHSTAVIKDGCQLEEGVRIGPYCVIGENVHLGRDTVVEGNSVIGGFTNIGKRCRIFPFSSIGLEPQDLKFNGEMSALEIGDDNIFREFVTVHSGTALGNSKTAIGNKNLFMAYSHVAHDCVIGNNVIFGNAATLGGHVMVEDHATVSAYSGVHQFCKVGAHSFIGGYSVITKDVLPFSKTVGNRACLYGANSIGLERRGFSQDRIGRIRSAFRLFQQSGLNVSQVLDRLKSPEFKDDSDISALVKFILSSERGVITKRTREEEE